MCGLAFVLLPPTSDSPVEIRELAADVGRSKNKSRTSSRPNNPLSSSGQALQLWQGCPSGTITSIVEALTVLAHGRFLHPDAIALGDFFLSRHHCAADIDSKVAGILLPRQPETKVFPGSISVATRYSSGTVDARVANEEWVQARDSRCTEKGRGNVDAQRAAACLVRPKNIFVWAGGTSRDLIDVLEMFGSGRNMATFYPLFAEMIMQVGSPPHDVGAVTSVIMSLDLICQCLCPTARVNASL